MIKKLFTAITIFVILLILFSTIGWKLFGFTYCDNPDVVYIDYEFLSNEEISITF